MVKTQDFWKLNKAKVIETKQNVLRKGAGRYGRKEYHGTSQSHAQVLFRVAL